MYSVMSQRGTRDASGKSCLWLINGSSFVPLARLEGDTSPRKRNVKRASASCAFGIRGRWFKLRPQQIGFTAGDFCLSLGTFTRVVLRELWTAAVKRPRHLLSDFPRGYDNAAP